MISLPYIFGFNIGFLLIIAIYAGAIFLAAKKLNFSKTKTVLLFIALFVVPIAWFSIIIPNWHTSIKNKIQAANYCEIDSDCIIDYFDSFTCGSLINKNEKLSEIYKDIKLYRSLSLDYSGCMGLALPKSVCENKKCINKISFQNLTQHYWHKTPKMLC